MELFTAFCREADNYESTTWIETVEAEDSTRAAFLARAKCADAWRMPVGDVIVVGLARGDVTIVVWDDNGIIG